MAASFTKECRKARTKSRIVKQLDFLYQFGIIYRAIFTVSQLFTSISTLGVRNTDSQEGAQIDLLIIRSDNVVNLCEMKFAGEPYIIIDKEEENKLRKRIEFLKKLLSPKQTIHLTIVTTYGVSHGKHSGIV